MNNAFGIMLLLIIYKWEKKGNENFSATFPPKINDALHWT
jgi:hypothetical protein